MDQPKTGGRWVRSPKTGSLRRAEAAARASDSAATDQPPANETAAADTAATERD